MVESRPLLLVDDDDVDAMAVRRMLKEFNVINELVHAANGEEALSYLRGAGNEMPCVILLDLNMPRMNGLEFLRIVKSNATLKTIPVVVVTTSDEQEDRAASFELGTAAYILKGDDYGEFQRNMRAAVQYLTPVQPPERPALAPS